VPVLLLTFLYLFFVSWFSMLLFAMYECSCRYFDCLMYYLLFDCIPTVIIAFFTESFLILCGWFAYSNCHYYSTVLLLALSLFIVFSIEYCLLFIFITMFPSPPVALPCHSVLGNALSCVVYAYCVLQNVFTCVPLLSLQICDASILF